MYNTGTRVFPAGDDTWGETWTETTKTMVLTYSLCDQFLTVVIEEG